MQSLRGPQSYLLPKYLTCGLRRYFLSVPVWLSLLYLTREGAKIEILANYLTSKGRYMEMYFLPVPCMAISILAPRDSLCYHFLLSNHIYQCLWGGCGNEFYFRFSTKICGFLRWLFLIKCYVNTWYWAYCTQRPQKWGFHTESKISIIKPIISPIKVGNQFVTTTVTKNLYRNQHLNPHDNGILHISILYAQNHFPFFYTFL